MVSIDLYDGMHVDIDRGACVLRPVEFERFGELIDLVGSDLFPDGPSTLAGWYDPDDLERSARRAVAYHAGSLADAGPGRWVLPLGVWVGGTLIGVQGVEAEGFLVRREAVTGSFLAPQWRGKGYGKLARLAILAVAFDELGADWVVSAAIVGNAASRAVSLAVGYEPDGFEVNDVGGAPQLMERFRMSREAWQQGTATSVQVDLRGFERLRNDIGLGA